MEAAVGNSCHGAVRAVHCPACQQYLSTFSRHTDHCQFGSLQTHRESSSNIMNTTDEVSKPTRSY